MKLEGTDEQNRPISVLHFIHKPKHVLCGILDQVRYLNVSFPDFCRLSYFYEYLKFFSLIGLFKKPTPKEIDILIWRPEFNLQNMDPCVCNTLFYLIL